MGRAERLITKYGKYIKQYETQKELGKYAQGRYNNLLEVVVSLKDIANDNSEEYTQIEQ